MEFKFKSRPSRRADDSLLRVNRQGLTAQRSLGPDMSYRRAPLLPKPHVSPRQLRLQRTEKQLSDFTVLPVVAQRQALAPMLEGFQLQRDVLSLEGPTSHRQGLQRQIGEYQASLGAGLLQAGQYEAAVQRQADLQTSVAPLTQRPSTPAQWSQGGQWEVQRVAQPGKPGRTINLREQEQSQHLGLLRTVGTQLGQGFRADTGPAAQRYAEYGEALAPFQRLGSGTGRAVVTTALMQVPVSQRIALQRAIDDTIQRQQAQETEDRAIIGLNSLQRQLEHLDGQPEQPLVERIQARRGAGNPIPDALRKALALELNHDLNAVRIHDDAEADTLAKKVNAVAFTTGQDIFFKAGTFNPNTRTGVELIAHEVTHTVQQAQGKAKPGIDGDAGLETEARAMGARFARAEPAAASGLAPRNAAISGAVAIQRAPASTLTSPKVASPVDTFKKLLQAAAIRTLDANAARILGQQKTYSNTSASEPAWSELRRIAALQVRMDQRWEQLSMRLFSQSQRAGIQTFDRVTTMIQATMGGRGRLSDSADVILGDMRTHLDPLALMGFGDFDSEQAKKQFELQVEEERQRERPLAETLSLITNVEDARDALHARYPAVGILTRDTAAVGLAATPNTVQNNAQLNARVQPEMKKVQQAIAELRAKIVAGDLPVMQMDVLVQEVLGSMTSDADRKQAQAWVGSERVRNQLIDIVLILATLGLTLVSLLVPGSTLLVVAGVGMGGATAAKGLVDANKQAGVSRTQDLGGKPLSSVSKAKAEEQLFIAWANTMLAAAPVVATAAGGLLRVGRAAPLAMKAGAAGRSAQEAGAALVGERTVAEAGTARSAAKSGPVGSTGRARTAGSVDLGTAAKRTVPDAQPAPRAGPGTGGMVPAVPEMVPPPGVTRPGLSRTPPNPRNPAQERYNQSRSAARRAEYQYDPKVRSELQLQKDLKPQVRTSETPAQLQQRVDLAQRELTVRQKIAGLGTKPWRPNLVENDAQTAGHSVDRHGWQLTLPDLKDRITGVGRWTKQESYSYKWTDETTANRVIQEHIRVNWDVIRRALAETGLYEGKPFNTSSRVGEGYYNKNVTLGGPRIPVYGETSWARVRIALNSDGKPYIITTFPVGGF